MLKEKIGQMLILGFKGDALKPDNPIVKAILAQQIGGVILFDYDYTTNTYQHNIRNPTQLKQVTETLQAYSKTAGDSLPLLIGIDYEGGRVNRLKENYGFPQTFAAADIATMSLPEAAVEAQKMAQTLQAVGINLNFAPVLDVNINPTNPVIGKLHRSFSSDPAKVISYAELFAKAYQDHGCISAFKHFPGHGSSTGDSHAGFVDVTSTWQEIELDPYKALLPRAKAAMVMTAHVVHTGLDEAGHPASLSYAITQKLLRDQLGFTGVVVTDDMQMKAITDNYSTAEAVRLAINAGADILVFGNQLSAQPVELTELIEMIHADVQAGKIPLKRIEEAYERIRQLKMLCLQKSPLKQITFKN